MIFYFSGTGNTRWVARQIADALSESLYNIAEELKGSCTYQLQPGERLGFCFPTHGWQPPHIVRTFLQRLSLQYPAYEERVDGFASKPFTWALTTCGDNMGEAMTILNNELSHLGLVAETQFSVIMPESYVCLPFMKTDPPEKEAWKQSNARHQLHHIIRVLTDNKRGVIELERGATPRLYTYVIGAWFNRHMITDRKFTVDADVCINCGLCAKVCPVGNISGTPPQWHHDNSCTMCLACYHHCPVHAINYGRITRRRGQYFCKL